MRFDRVEGCADADVARAEDDDRISTKPSAFTREKMPKGIIVNVSIVR